MNGILTRLLASPWLRWFVFALLLLGLIVVLHLWTSRSAPADLDLLGMLESLRTRAAHPLAPLLVVPVFVLGGLVIAPVTVMIAICGLIFGPWIASLSAIAGTLATTAVNHELGRYLGRAIERRAPSVLTERMRKLGRSSDVWSLAGLRLVPIAPFAVVSLLAGAAHVRLRDFVLGTLLAFGPGIVLICFSVDRARAAVAGEPVFEPWVLATIVIAGIAVIGLRAWQRTRQKTAGT